MRKLTIEDIDISGKKVLLRVDFNVPLNEYRKITDTSRIEAVLPTIRYCINQGAKVVLISHLGRPKGQVVEKLSLKPVAQALSTFLNQEVSFCPSAIGEKAQQAIEKINFGQCIVLENIRFYPEETQNDPSFGQKLASLADCYINDAFGTVHRAHASTEGVAHYFDQAACGYLIQKELEYLGRAVETPLRPFTAILGGAKVKDKIQVFQRLVAKADHILVGGGMAYTFLKVKGMAIGKSMLDSENLEFAENILELAEKQNVRIHLPTDHIVAPKISEEVKGDILQGDIPEDLMGLDIGLETIQQYETVINESKTILWNGPMGVFEIAAFRQGTFAIANAMAKNQGVTVVGGGESVAAVNLSNNSSAMTHVSTGGGASLQFLEGKALPGIEALKEK